MKDRVVVEEEEEVVVLSYAVAEELLHSMRVLAGLDFISLLGSRGKTGIGELGFEFDVRRGFINIAM